MIEAITLSAVDDATCRADKPSAVDAAARFVALQPGGAARILLEHDRRPDGTCGGCLTSPVTWPCVVSVIAKRAQEMDPLRPL
jgi:hypothetical protein